MHAQFTLVLVLSCAASDLYPPCCCRTVTDVGLGDNPAGLAVAAMSVVSSGMQQIFCRTMQQKHKLSSHELLANTAPAQVEHPHAVWLVCFRAYMPDLFSSAAGLDITSYWAVSGSLRQQLLGVRLQLHIQCACVPRAFLQYGSFCEYITIHVPWTIFCSFIPGEPGVGPDPSIHYRLDVVVWCSLALRCNKCCACSGMTASDKHALLLQKHVMFIPTICCRS